MIDGIVEEGDDVGKILGVADGKKEGTNEGKSYAPNTNPNFLTQHGNHFGHLLMITFFETPEMMCSFEQRSKTRNDMTAFIEKYRLWIP